MLRNEIHGLLCGGIVFPDKGEGKSVGNRETKSGRSAAGRYPRLAAQTISSFHSDVTQAVTRHVFTILQSVSLLFPNECRMPEQRAIGNDIQPLRG